MLTQERLKQVLDYDPETGAFTYKIDRANKKVGDVAGYVMASGYVTITIDYEAYYGHHLAVLFMTGKWPPKKSHTDHRNGQEADNRWVNLRVTTPLVNLHNRKGLNKNNTSGAPGIKRFRDGYRAVIGFNWKNITIGTYPTLEEAVAAREDYRKSLPIHG